MRGDTVQIRLVGVNVDNRADGKGKAGLTFMTTTYVGESDTNMADTNHNIGGYRDLRNRKDYNEGRYKSTISSNVYQYLAPVLKIQDNQANGEMSNWKHSATSNAIVEKVSMPSPLELNMNVTQQAKGNSYNNGSTPTGLTQYNGGYYGGWWLAYYSYLYSGNAPYEYYQNNTRNISEYCKLVKGDGLYSSSDPSCKNVLNNYRRNRNYRRLWLRSPNPTPSIFSSFDSYGGGLGGNGASDSANQRVAAVLSF